MSAKTTFRVFLSAVSRELASYREEVARVLRRQGLQVSVQEEFNRVPHTLLEKLRDHIAGCDAVVALIGGRCGAFPTPGQVAALGPIPRYEPYLAAGGQSQASYTQWGYLLGLHLQRKTHRLSTAWWLASKSLARGREPGYEEGSARGAERGGAS
jgi:hypothetical protein